MFDELRKRISNAVKGFIKKEEVEEKKEEQKLDINISAKTKIKGVFLKSVQLSEPEIDDFAENLRMSLLESDVSYKTTDEFIELLKRKLIETKFDSKNIKDEMVGSVRESLLEVLRRSKSGIPLNEFVKNKIRSGEVPIKILFLGPNGTGKTTTMGKIATSLKKDGINCVFSASDTFRAAAIEQTEHHANKIGVPVIKSKYGADPASVAFDAIAYAKAHDIPVVLIDTAGRQETNKNLINEMQKMVRVAKPDFTIFVGESISGNALTNQVQEFSKYMKIDGIILTKLDADAKGGNAISIANTTGIPILFFGIGESYDALVPYTPEFVVDSILPNN
jgi:fused signal recognition particle receptor